MSTLYQQTHGLDYSELHGINGVTVSARAAVLLTKRKKQFIWWLQGMSLKEGGLKWLARELIEMFPDRIGTKDMHKEKINAAKMYPGELVGSVERDLGLRDYFNKSVASPKSGDALIQLCRGLALRHYRHSEVESYSGRKHIQSLEEFMVALCVNPTIYFQEPGEQTDFSSLEADMAIDEFPELSRHDFSKASVCYFRDIVGALFEYKARREASTRENFCLTAIGKKIWETLDFALASRGMVVLDGLEGRGKTEAVKAWVECHLGRSRFASLPGTAVKTMALKAMGKPLGIPAGYSRTGAQLQSRIEDVLQRSGILLVVDEAHFLFSQSRRMNSRPELVDWIDTAICNQGIGIALVTTPQFLKCMTRAAVQLEWNYLQFRRRVKRWPPLPANNTTEDIRAVVKKVFKTANAGMIRDITAYALMSKRDLSAVGDVADVVRTMLGSEDLSLTKPEHIKSAIDDYLRLSDKTFLEGMAEAVLPKKTQGKQSLPPTEDSLEEPEPPVLPTPHAGTGLEVIPPTPSDRPVVMPGSRSHARTAELVQG
jgi:AAA domain